MGNYYDENGIYHEVARDERLDNEEPNYWRGSATKEGANPKAIAKRRKNNKTGRKTKQRNRR